MDYGNNLICYSNSIFYVEDILSGDIFDRKKVKIIKLQINDNEIKIQYITFYLPTIEDWKESECDNLYEYFCIYVKSTKPSCGYYNWNTCNGYYDKNGKLLYNKPLYFKDKSCITIEKVKELLNINSSEYDEAINNFISQI